MAQKSIIRGRSVFVLQDGTVAESCPRCSGDGGMSYYAHVHDGICFQCKGRRIIGATFASEADAEKVFARRDRTNERRRAKKAAEAEAKAAKKAADEAAFIAKYDIQPAVEIEETLRGEHLGAAGEAIVVTGKVIRLRDVESFYGSNRMVVIDSGGSEIVTFTTAKWAYDIDEGDEITVKGIVSDHGEYDGARTTKIKRPKRIA